jgi:hypothetical protein
MPVCVGVVRYVRDLYMLNQLFVMKLREKEILTREEISSIFANIPTLQDMHLELFKVRALCARA